MENSSPVLGCNDIYNNGVGLRNETPSTVVNAQNQWWGSASGPYHELLNPNGTGNSVTDGVNFSPWRFARCNEKESLLEFTIYLPLAVK
jgi:hypothetical protein